MKRFLAALSVLCAGAAFGQQTPDAPSALSSLQNASFDTAAKEKPAAALPDAPSSKAKPEHSTAEKALFWSSYAGFHAAWAADFTTTGMILNKGGYEMDPLYTRFGNRNMASVIGSAAAVHA